MGDKNFQLDKPAIQNALTTLAKTDGHVKAAIDLVGYPDERKRPHGFATLLRVIVGQQLSVKAAASIAEHVEALMDNKPKPELLMTFDDETLRGAGLSRQKIGYVRSLCEAVTNGPLDIMALPDMSDEEAMKAITSVKGLGRWSAEMYMMFSLGRTDVWPVGDLAVRAGIGRIIELTERPNEKELDVIGERWRPYRSSMALLAWHYYSNAPM
ncbi:DNA-3-methyladenine glycosylase [Kordiimonas sp. SCSIO 12610]|uniref:DNA-3-methyladenine glycosylase family protein n=1 Tax=Kordiimonas sp. SCSIO 12610 TaxID=2829597 RepID=UPI00210D5B97|nr:DNA-3-methyladenine glycosylase 2 family protein [Kordiimonas sp. SCSIO 12610]UTW55255.1 DNA-3-methyladenine glycosylase 2 family protein [Kordiimonas sp. SCSIO 12610]